MKKGATLLVAVAVLSVGIASVFSLWAGNLDQERENRPPDPNPDPPVCSPSMKPDADRPPGNPFSNGSPVHEAVLFPASDTVRVVLPLGECFKETYVCSIPEVPPAADILFDFDLTGSMMDELSNLKSNSVAMMKAIREDIPNSNFGLMSGEDYDAQFTSQENCGYNYEYGANQDSPYRLNTPLTGDTERVRNAVNYMALGSGRDCPECYARRFYEAYAELTGAANPQFGAIGWRPEAKKIVVSFNDALPHDCNWTECSGIPPSGFCVEWTTSGRDPGRDARAGTADDLVLLDVLKKMGELKVTLIDIYSGEPSVKAHWDCWTEMTPGGGTFQINQDGTIPGGMPIDSFIVEVIKSSFDTVRVVAPDVCAGDSVFLRSVVPPRYDNVSTPAVVSFEVELCSPVDIPLGEYCLDMCYLADGGEVARRTYCIQVVESNLYVDVKPGSCPNPLNVKSQGVLPVAVLGTPWLDVNLIDVSSVLLAGVAPIRAHVEDVSRPVVRKPGECDCTTEGPDGIPDLTLKFRTQDMVQALGDVFDRDTVELELTGRLIDGDLPPGHDCVVIIHNEWRKLNPDKSDVQSFRYGLAEPEKTGFTHLFPNPVSGRTAIEYWLVDAAEHEVTIYDLAGRVVRTLSRGPAGPGGYSVEWDCTDEAGVRVHSGTYFCRLRAGDTADVMKITLLK